MGTTTGASVVAGVCLGLSSSARGVGGGKKMPCLFRMAYLWQWRICVLFIKGVKYLFPEKWVNSADQGIGFPKGLNWIVDPQEFTGVGYPWARLRGKHHGDQARSIRTCCDSTTWLVFVLPNTSPSTQRPPLPLRMSQLPPHRREEPFCWVVRELGWLQPCQLCSQLGGTNPIESVLIIL